MMRRRYCLRPDGEESSLGMIPAPLHRSVPKERSEEPLQSARDFARAALDALSQALPLTAGRCYVVGADLQVNDLERRNLPQGWPSDYRRFWRLDPLHPSRFWNRLLRVAVLDADHCCCANSQQYLHEFLLPRGIGSQADVFLRDDSGIYAGFSLLRAAHLGPFASRELQLLQTFAPLLDISAVRVLAGLARPACQDYAQLNLTERERTVAAMIAEGRTNKEIGRLLGVGLCTVKTHVRRILSKANVTSRTAFVSRLYLQH